MKVIKRSQKVSRKEIKEFVKEIVRKFEPEKIILFGSYGYGKPDEESDVDLFVIMNTKKSSIAQEVEIRMEIERNFPLDLIVMTPEEIEKRIKRGDTFLQTILEKGEVLYEKRKQRVV